jgi:ABC-type uncharacterized transport system substrate-binding protein
MVATPNSMAARAAMAATATIPILFSVADDSAKLGLALEEKPGVNTRESERGRQPKE